MRTAEAGTAFPADADRSFVYRSRDEGTHEEGMQMILLGLGTAVAIVGAVVLGDEWRRAGLQRERVLGSGLRVEVAAVAALIIGIGVAIGYAGITP